MKPILFNTEMVRAVLDERKTVTRRLVSEKIMDDWYSYDEWVSDAVSGCAMADITCTRTYINEFLLDRSRYQVGNILYVRETWCEHPNNITKMYADACYFRADSYCDGKVDDEGDCPVPYDFSRNCNLCEWCDGDTKWKPSIHMPKKYARIFLRVTDVRVERLQDITEEQAIKEGAVSIVDEIYDQGYVVDYEGLFARDNFAEIWNSTVDKKELDQYGWDANPYVFVYEFEVISKEEAMKDGKAD